MSTLLDSEAQFIQRTIDLGLSDELRKALKDQSLRTFGTYAYAHGQPGQRIIDDAFEKWVQLQLLATASLADIAIAKRLLFESQTLVMQSIKEMASTPSDSSVKRVPNVERESKMKVLKKRLAGLLVEGPLEPGHSLLDAAAAMVQSNEFKYLPPEKCVSRTHEVMNAKTPNKQIDISSETLVIKENREVPDMSVASALQVQEALQRRGLALVFADAIEWDSYSRYITTLFSHLHREPPAGFARCSVSQLVAADKAVWQLIIEEDVKPKRDESGTLALNTCLMDALKSYQVSFSLMPLPAKKDSPQKKDSNAKRPGGGYRPNYQVSQQWKPKGKGGKGKSKGKTAQRVPSNIYKLGGTAANPEGEPICFAFNSEAGCSESADGGRCRRGLHICAKCYNSHSIMKHHENQ